ncbi:hypothetical protein ACI68E_000551 [Malassezia pachydermatis]
MNPSLNIAPTWVASHHHAAYLGKDAFSLDTGLLDERLDSLLLDLQAGTEKVRNVWEMWEDLDDERSWSIMDKPNTAPPPGSPSGKMMPPQAQPGSDQHIKTEHIPTVTMDEVMSAFSEL